MSKCARRCAKMCPSTCQNNVSVPVDLPKRRAAMATFYIAFFSKYSGVIFGMSTRGILQKNLDNTLVKFGRNL